MNRRRSKSTMRHRETPPRSPAEIAQPPVPILEKPTDRRWSVAACLLIAMLPSAGQPVAPGDGASAAIRGPAAALHLRLGEAHAVAWVVDSEREVARGEGASIDLIVPRDRPLILFAEAPGRARTERTF